MSECSRIDVMRNLPGILKDSFVILMDDTNRTGERNCLSKMMDSLDTSGIAYCSSEYVGEKTMSIIAS